MGGAIIEISATKEDEPFVDDSDAFEEKLTDIYNMFDGKLSTEACSEIAELALSGKISSIDVQLSDGGESCDTDEPESLDARELSIGDEDDPVVSDGDKKESCVSDERVKNIMEGLTAFEIK